MCDLRFEINFASADVSGFYSNGKLTLKDRNGEITIDAEKSGQSTSLERENQELKEENAKLRADVEILKNRPSFDALLKIRDAMDKKITVAISGNIKKTELLNKQRSARHRLVEDLKAHLQLCSVKHITDQQLADALKFIEDYKFTAEKAV